MRALQCGVSPRLRRWGVRVGVVAITMGGAWMAQAAPASLCESLAQTLRRERAAVWQQAPGPLRQRLVVATSQALASVSPEMPDPFVSALLRDAVASEVALQRLPGQALAHLYTRQGTAQCQSSRFLLQEGDGRWRSVAGPAFLDEHNGPCWSLSGSLATLDGQPLFAVYGRERQASEDEVYHLAAWEGGQWAPSCSLRLSYALRYRLSAAYCTAAPVTCRRARALALPLGQRYDRSRASGARFVPPRATPVPAALKAALARLDLMAPPEFPEAVPRPADAFEAGYAHADLHAFALQLEGGWFLAMLGHAGVGWRESAVTLLGLYALDPLGQLVPVAGYRVLRERAAPPALQVDDRR